MKLSRACNDRQQIFYLDRNSHGTAIISGVLTYVLQNTCEEDPDKCPLKNEPAPDPDGGAASDDGSPPLPDKIVGDQGDPRAGPSKGKRHNSGPLTPENGGTGNAQDDFDSLTGGTGTQNPNRPPGTLTGDNGITLRPGSSGEGSRIDIPANGSKPPETLHY